jgi:hypothetical protein
MGNELSVRTTITYASYFGAPGSKMPIRTPAVLTFIHTFYKSFQATFRIIL